MNWVLSLDQSLFRLINQDFSFFLFDIFFMGVTFLGEIPWVLGFVWLVLLLKGGPKERLFCLFVIPLILMSDLLPTYVLKPYFGRLRPFLSEEGVRLLIENPAEMSLYGFPSNHATNIFALATLVCLFYREKRIVLTSVIVAFLVGFSRIYVGVHFPLDVVFGGLLGTSLGFLVYEISTILNV